MARTPMRTGPLLLPLAFAFQAGCGDAGEIGTQEDETMQERLERLAADPGPETNRFANSAILEAMLSDLASYDPLAVAEQLLATGRFEEGIALLERLQGELAAFNRQAPPPERVGENVTIGVKRLLAVARLRLADAEGCLRGLGSSACPSSGSPGGGRTGAAAAVAAYAELAELAPDEVGFRWMLNIAHMMAGSYPDSLPPHLLVPPSAFGGGAGVGRFRDLAPELGLDVAGHVGGAVMDDFTGDGLLDLLATSWQLRDPLRYHVNTGEGGFEHLTGVAGLEGLWGGGNVKQADYDNDGDLDAFVMRGGWLPVGQPNSLLQNQGDGTFRDATGEAGLLIPERPTQTAAWLDFDGDGWLDLFVGNETWGRGPYPCQLFRNLGDGSFVDVAPELGVDVVGAVKGATAGDYDNDGRPDLYLALVGSDNLLLRNEGPGADGSWSFSDRTPEAGVAEPVDAFPTWFWDFDNDGWLDIYVAGYRTQFGDVAREYLGMPHDSEQPRLYRNRGDGTFEDASVRTGLVGIHFAMGSNYGDLDNDGWLDFYVGTGDPNLEALMPNRMFRSLGGAFFEEVTASGGFGLLHKGHGVAFGDIDNDGDQDVFVAMGGAYEADLARNSLFENPGHGNRWLSLGLEGTTSNRSAFGARVLVEVEGEDGELRRIHRTVSSGGSFGGNPLRLDIGLGAGPVGDGATIRVEWPASGVIDRVSGVAVNAGYLLVEGSGEATRRLGRP